VENASPILKASLPSLKLLESKQWNWTLRDADPKVFQIVALDMYNQDWGIPDPEPYAYIDDANDGLIPEVQRMFDDDDLLLVKVWLLAERLVMPHLQNKAMSRLQKRWASYDSKPNSSQRERTSLYKPSSNWIKHVYDHTSSGSLLRNFAGQHGLLFIDPEDFDELGHRFPKEFLLELARLFAWTTKPIVFKNTFETGHLVGQAMRDGQWEFSTCFVDTD
jgi:hypothetical protein